MEFTPTTRTASAEARPSARSAGFSGRDAPKRTKRFDRNAFLRHSFRPLVATSKDELDDQQAIENGFYHSAANLCKLYNLGELPHCEMPYPLNLGQCMEWLKAMLSEIDKCIELKLLQDVDFPARLATVKTFSTGNVLFYLPIAPMLRLLENAQTQAVGELLLSVYSYLYQIVGLSHYATGCTYLDSIYNMLEDWWVNDGEYAESEDEQAAYEHFFEMLWERGRVSLLLMGASEHLQAFGSRVAHFEPSSKAQKEFHHSARKCYELYRQYPDRSLEDHIIAPYQSDTEEYTIRLEQYLHFFWDFNQIVHDQFMDCINAELNECSLIDEPTTLQYFDRPQKTVVHDQDFEQRLFALLHELTDHVIDLDHD